MSTTSQRDRDDRVLAVLLGKDREISELQQRIEAIIGERDRFEAALAKEAHHRAKAEQQHSQCIDDLRKARSTIDSLTAAAAGRPDAATTAALEDDLKRKSDQIDELIRALADERARAERIAPQSNASQSGSSDWLVEREEMASLILDQQQRIESLEGKVRATENENNRLSELVASLQRQLAAATSKSTVPPPPAAPTVPITTAAAAVAQIASLERELKHAHDQLRMRDVAPEESIPAQGSSLEKASAILASKQKEVEELTRDNQQLREQIEQANQNAAYRHANQQPQHTSPNPLAPPPNFLQTVDHLRSQLLLCESELASKSHALQLAELAAREASVKLSQAEDHAARQINHARDQAARRIAQLEDEAARSQAAIAAAEERIKEMQLRVTNMNQVQAQCDAALRQVATLDARVHELNDRDVARSHAAHDAGLRSSEQARVAEELYTTELAKLRKMVHTMVKQVTETAGVVPAVSGAPSATRASSVESAESSFQADFHQVLHAISSLIGSRDMYKLSSTRFEKRVQTLEKEIDDLHSHELRRSEEAVNERQARQVELDSANRAHVATITSLELRLASSSGDVARLTHSLSESESRSLALEKELEVESNKLKVAEEHSKKLQSQMRLKEDETKKEIESVADELLKMREVCKEKEQQVQLLLQTVDALQTAQAAEDRASVAAAGRPTPKASQTLSAQLLTFSAQLSHCKAQEALLRRSLKQADVSLRRAVERGDAFEVELSELRNKSIPELQRGEAQAIEDARALKLELGRVNGRMSRSNEDLASLRAELGHVTTLQQAAESRTKILEEEIRDQRQLYIESMTELRQQAKKDQEDMMVDLTARMRMDDAIDAGAPQRRVGLTSGVNAQQSAHHSPTMLRAIKELSTSILQAITAVTATQPDTTTTAHTSTVNLAPFTPQKKSRSSDVSSLAPAPSPSFVLNSPTSHVHAEVAPASSERSAILPAIFEHLLNLVLESEGDAIKGESQRRTQEWQLRRMLMVMMQKDTELDELRSKYAIYSQQHEKLLGILRSKNELTQVFLRDQQRTMTTKIDSLQSTLFTSQSSLLAKESSESHLMIQVESLTKKLFQQTRMTERKEIEWKNKISEIERQVEKDLADRWVTKEEELKKYVEQVLRPLIVASGPDGGATTEQIAQLSGTIAALKLVESDCMRSLELARKDNESLVQQASSWHRSYLDVTRRLRDLEERWIRDGGDPDELVDERATQAIIAEFGTPQLREEEEKWMAGQQTTTIQPTKPESPKQSQEDAKATQPTSAAAAVQTDAAQTVDRATRTSPSEDRSSSRRRRRRSNSRDTDQSTPPRDRKEKDGKKAKKRSHARSSSSSQSRSRSRSPRPSHIRRRSNSPIRRCRMLESRVDYLAIRESELVTQLKQATSVQEQLEQTIEDLIQAAKEAEDQREQEERRREREQREMRDREKSRERERDRDIDSRRDERDSRGGRDRDSKRDPLDDRRSGKTSASSSSRPSKSTSDKKKNSSSSSSSDKLEAAESSMAASLAATILQVTKTLREREAALNQVQAEVANLKNQLATQAAERAAIEEESNQLKTVSTKHVNEVKSLKDQLSHYEASLSDGRSRDVRLAELTTANVELQRQLDDSRSSSASASTKLSHDILQIQQQLLPLGVENGQLKHTLQELERKLDHSMRLENEERQKNIQLNEYLKEAETELSSRQGKIHSLDKSLLQIQDRLNRLEDDYTQDRTLWEQEISSREKEKLVLKNMITSLEQSRMELHVNHQHLLNEKELRENDTAMRIRDLEASLTKELDERTRILAREQDFLDRIQKVEHENQALIDSKELDHNRYQADLQAMKSANSILEETLNTARADLDQLVHVQAEYELSTAELKTLRCQHMEYLDSVNDERDGWLREKEMLVEQVTALRTELAAKSSQLPEELSHQKGLYQEMIVKLKQRIQTQGHEHDQLENDLIALEQKLSHVTDMNVSNAQARVRAEEERDLLVTRFETLDRQRDAQRIELENTHSVALQVAQQEFRTLQQTFEEFRKGHEVLVGVYQEQHARLLNRLKRALEAVAESERRKEAKLIGSKKPTSSKGVSEKESTFTDKLVTDSNKTPFVSDLAQGRLVFDMAELLSNLSEREASVRSLQNELEQTKRALAHLNAQHGTNASIARPLTAILSTNSNVINAVTATTHATSTVHATSHKKKKHTVHGTATVAKPAKEAGEKENTFSVSLSVQDLPPLAWHEERSLVVLGGELAHMELQLKTAQRQALNEKESSIHFEEQWKLTQLSLNETREKLRATQKDLSMLQRHTTGTIKAQEQEIAKITESLRSEEEWCGLMKSVADGKAAIKHAKEDLARKSKQLTQSHDDLIRLKSQLEDLETQLHARDDKILKLTRSNNSKDVLVIDLKKKFEGHEAEDKLFEQQTKEQGDRLRTALAQVTKKDATIKELKMKLEQQTIELDLAQQQVASLSTTQAQLKQAQKEISQTQKRYDDAQQDCQLLEKQKNDLDALSREATRIGAAYDTLRNLIRDLALHQVEAIDQLSSTLHDLERADETNQSMRIDGGEISVRDVETLSVAAEFSKEDLQDILSTTMRVDPMPLGGRSRTGVYARRIFADLEVQLARDISLPSVIALVRTEFVKLLDERVRMELLVLNAATKGSTHAGTNNESSTGPGAGEAHADRASARRSVLGSTGISSSASTGASVSASAASARVRSLEEQLHRHDMNRAARVTAAQEKAREAREIEREQRSRSSSPDTRHTHTGRYQPTSSTRFTAHIFDDRRHGQGHRYNDTDSISSIDSRG